MTDTFNSILLLVAALTVISILSTVFAFRAGAPILLVFLAVGFLAGEDGIGDIDFDDAATAFKIGNIALALILFDSGFGTPWRSFRLAAAPALTLATFGVLLTAFGIAGLTMLVTDLGFGPALLLGAILGSTDAAAVFFLLRVGGIHLRDRVRSTLEVESGSNDPMAIFLTMLLIGLLTAAQSGPIGEHAIVEFARQMGLGLVLGVIGGHVVRAAMNRLELESGLYPILIAALALSGFALTNLLGGSGALAVYLAGLVAGKLGVRRERELRRFQQGLTWLAQIAMFVALGLLATPSEFPALLVPGLAIGLGLIFIVRPLAVFVSLAPFRMGWAEQAFVGFVGLRGAVSLLLAILPLVAGLPEARTLFNLAFIAVLVSLLVQGWGIAPMARWLGLVVPERGGPVDRLELDLPDKTAHQLIAYHLQADSPLVTGTALPRWLRPALVVRNGRSYRGVPGDRLRGDDIIYVFVRPHRVPLLDRLVASPRQPDQADREFFGDFAIDVDAAMADLVEFYGADVRADRAALAVGHFLEREFGPAVEPGDRVGLGRVELIVRAIDDRHRVTEAGLTILRERIS
jgi:cell volume regulation protein A